jgi:aryl-alcohol dehydrogenase-like predicted oxidoreductase
MKVQTLGQTGLKVSPIGFGAFKIGRNQKIKYPTPYDLPTEADVEKLLNAVLDMGISYIDTAPAYGLSEERIGRSIAHRRDEFVLSTKIGETFRDGQSHYDYSAAAVRESIDRSRRLVGSEMLDLVFIHSNGDDLAILNETGTLSALQDLQQQGLIRAVGMSHKTLAGGQQALALGANVLMATLNHAEREDVDLIAQAGAQGCGVLIKKALASGHTPEAERDAALRWVAAQPGVSSLVIGSINQQHLVANAQVLAS